MGTRGFTGWKIDGRVLISYQQFDSYPSGVGAQVATDLRAIQEGVATDLLNAKPELKRDLRALTEATRSELRRRFARIRRLTDRTKITPTLIAKLEPVTNTDVSTGADIYALTRELQGNLAGMFDLGIAYHYGDGWPTDSLFCEWGYLLNFDADDGLGRFEVYRGFQKAVPTAGEWAGQPAPLEDRYEWTTKVVKGVPKRVRKTVGREPSEYFPVNCVRWFSLVPPPSVQQVVDIEEEVERKEDPEDWAEKDAADLAAEGILAKQNGA